MAKNRKKRGVLSYLGIALPFIATSLVLSFAPKLANDNASVSKLEASITESDNTVIFSAEAPTEWTKLEKITPEPEPTPAPEAALEPASPVGQVAYTPPPFSCAPHAGFTGTLSISSIRLCAPIQTVGTIEVPGGKQIDVPAHNVGWFNQTHGLSSASGTSFLDGHNDGIFSYLHLVGAGQTIQIHANGGTQTFVVRYTEVQELNSIRMNPILTAFNGGRGITLMTCYGSYTGATFSHRFIVYAELI